MECLNCGKSVESSTTKPRKYCNDSCKAAYFRKKRNESSGKVENRDGLDKIRNAVKESLPRYDMGSLTYTTSTKTKVDPSNTLYYVEKWTDLNDETPNQRSVRLAKEQIAADKNWEHEKRYEKVEEIW